MGSSFPVLFLVLMAAAAQAAVSPRDYWQSKLPDAPMPAAIRDALPADEDVVVDGAGVASRNFYQKGIAVEGQAAADIGRARVTNFYQKEVGVDGLAATDVRRGRVTNFYQKGVGVDGLAAADIGRVRVSNFYQKGVGVEGLAATDGNRVRVSSFYEKGVGDDSGLTATGFRRARVSNFYKNGMDMKQRNKPVKQILAESDGTNFFLEKDLRPGVKIWLDFSRITPEKLFISRGAASSIPFSSEKLSLILDSFSVNLNFPEAEIMSMTLQGCEEAKDSTEETKFCATSLESMVDYAISALETDDLIVVSTELSDEDATLAQEYSVAATAAVSPMQRLPGGRAVACHQQPYPYAVFYCHVTRATRAYVVPLVGVANGVRAVAVAVCHDDTSAWSPSHPAFQVLKVAPGALPICHFLPQDTVVWAPKADALLPPVSDN